MRRVRVIICGLAPLLAACSDRSVDDWMIGVFSTRGPAASDQFGMFERYRIEEDGDVSYEFVSGPTVTATLPRTWEQDGKNAIVIFPGQDDGEQAQEHDTWKLTREGRCGPYKFEHLIDGEPFGDAGSLTRGELCARERTDPCEGECDCCVLYWCEPPPPCE